VLSGFGDFHMGLSGQHTVKENIDANLLIADCYKL
jgi:hypothetical protein